MTDDPEVLAAAQAIADQLAARELTQAQRDELRLIWRPAPEPERRAS